MGFFKRTKTIVESKLNQLLDSLEDPNALLDLSYEKMLTALQDIKKNLADVVTEQKQLEHQVAELQDQAERARTDAKIALQSGREDLAKRALQQEQDYLTQIGPLQEASQRITSQADRLKEAERKFKERINHFKTQKEISKATYNAAKAEVKVSESMGGIGKEFGGIGDTMKRANDKTEKMAARAEALESLAEEGILEDPLDTRSQLDKDMDNLRKQNAIDDELEKLKKELGES
ncbi:PspA/IM30 family protein [Pullulanibacillus sp. KACC 23026]|uniref:PspA/IM30 family protein n=1 Tax=Pullulanibacillus sp. KACC 23026 TaxID=3028315 RepID=UPI0023B0F227|nr:PspA/IM30 family protein [Pullulanibacillus sp. KACC 23026]WEG11177.1 PspA/IM30 family protein [Pullulanibacillus sp. KACC 23026]